VRRAGLLLGVAWIGACSQPLTDASRGTGGAAGRPPAGTGGAAGDAAAVDCSALQLEYQAILDAARACDPTAAAPCSGSVRQDLSVCDDCFVFVGDASKPYAAAQAWHASGCDDASPVGCGPISCEPVVYTLCVPNGDGTGTCKVEPSAPRRDGGAAECAALADAYATALARAAACSPGGTVAPCAQDVLDSLTPCPGACEVYVSDSTELDALRSKWDQIGCYDNPDSPEICTDFRCPRALGGMCAETDGGAASCQTFYSALPSG
jgi:hypothetical protein